MDEEIANIQPQELLDNDHYLRDAIGDLGQDLIDHETDVSNPHNVTHAQTGPEAADPTKTTTSRHKHVSDADLKQVYDTKSDLAAHHHLSPTKSVTNMSLKKWWKRTPTIKWFGKTFCEPIYPMRI